MNQQDTKTTPAREPSHMPLAIGLAAASLATPNLPAAAITPADLRPAPITASAPPAEHYDVVWGNAGLPQAPQNPPSKPLPPSSGSASAPAPAAQITPEQKTAGSALAPAAPAPAAQTPAEQKTAASAPAQAAVDPQAQAPQPTANKTSSELQAIRQIMREEIAAEAARQAPAPAEESHSLFWKTLTTITAFMAFQGYWRWRYRTQDDFRRKASDLRGMLRDDSLYFEDAKFVVAYDRTPKHREEKRQLVVENPRAPRELDVDLETIIGPYCSQHLRRAALRCTDKDPFIMDHVSKVPISWAWVRDEFFRWEFKSAMRLLKARTDDEKRFTSDLINLRLKTAIESALGEQAIDILEGRDRDPRHFLIAVLCDVQQNHKSPTGEMRRIIVRIVPDDQFALYGDPAVLERMRNHNCDNMSREIDLIARLYERESKLGSVPHAESSALPPGHPRRNRPEYDYCEAVRLILRPAESTPADPERIREAHGQRHSKK